MITPESFAELARHGKRPRVIEGRGLGPDEQDAEGWFDREGDRWRYNHGKPQWEYLSARDDINTGWLRVPTEPGGHTSPEYAPYREIIDHPAPDADLSAGVGLPTFTADEFMDAANAARQMATRTHGQFAEHWRDLADRFEDAAIAASK